jgi:uncharacterized Fe-S center protein
MLQTKRVFLRGFSVLLGIYLGSMLFLGCAAQKAAPQTEIPYIPEQTVAGVPKVYMTTDISPAGLMAVYEALGREASGNKVAIKLSTGEAGNPNHLDPDLIKDLVQRVNGTIVEGNTAYPGSKRIETIMHYQVARDHGFTNIAPVVILDENGEITLPVPGGKHLKEVRLGDRFFDYDFHVILSHFKGHPMGGFGGAIKNVSIGYSSPGGKMLIHTGGRSDSLNSWGIAMRVQNDFLESMADVAKAFIDTMDEKVLYIKMNNLSVDCDCIANPAPISMAHVGIFASLDPVAVDQACVEQVYAAHDGKDIAERIESRNGFLTLEWAEIIGLGSRTYELVKL